MADGTYTADGGVYVPLWDISGDYETNSPEFGSVEFELTQEPNGDFTGEGTQDVSSFLFDGEGDIIGDLTLNGSMGGSGEKPTANMRLEVTSSNFDAENIQFKSITEKATIGFSFNVKNRVLSGNGNGSVTAVLWNPGIGRYVTETESKSIAGVDLPLPSDATGDWTLTLNLTPASGTKYSSTASSATITTSAETVLDFTVTGTYSAKTGVSDLTLKGEAGTLTLDVTTSGDLVSIESISGKVSGQTLSYKQPKS